MKNIGKVVFVIIGTIIGAGFASRKRDLFIFWKIWNGRDNWHSNFLYLYGNHY